MGWWPTRLCVVLNLVLLLGYGMINSLILGQMLSAVAHGHLSVVVGIMINALLSFVVTEFGMPLFHIFERWIWIPELIALIVLYAAAGRHFDNTTQSTGDAVTVTSNRLSMVALCLGATSGWATGAGDYFVYFAEKTSRTSVLVLITLGVSLGGILSSIAGVGIASGKFHRSEAFCDG